MQLSSTRGEGDDVRFGSKAPNPAGSALGPLGRIRTGAPERTLWAALAEPPLPAEPGREPLGVPDFGDEDRLLPRLLRGLPPILRSEGSS